MIFTFHELAVEEMGVAKDWYELRSPPSALRLLRETQAALNRIARSPELCPQFCEGYRWARIKRFPYILVFELLAPDVAKVVAIAHTSRRPGYWLDRA